MIIRSVRLNPFGGISDRKIKLENGLNVIIGPNEVGKSTIYNGIQKALFTPSQLNKNDFKKEIKNYIPVGGGDTARVEMQLLHNEKLYTLSKTWGGSIASELLLPDGNPISDEAVINEKLKSLMAAGPGTYRSVLMTYQSGLAKTLDDLSNDSDTIHSLGSVIRKTMLETDGVSVEKFRDRIEELYGKYFKHWDLSQNYPEKNRGIDNPYKKDVGDVLGAFYEKEYLRVELENALSYEEELDEINNSLQACEFEIAGKERYLKENEKAVDDARKRQIKFLDLKLKKTEITQFSKDNMDWVISENKSKELNDQIPLVEENLEKLKKERSVAEKKAENEVLIQTFKRVKEHETELERAKESLKSAIKLDDTDLKGIRDAFNEVNRLKESIKAGKLRAKFEAKKTFTLTIQKDLETEYEKGVSSGESFLLEAGGRLKLEHPEWKLEISSGEEEIEKVLESYKAAKQKRENLLNQYGIQSQEEAEELNKRYTEALNAFINATSNFKKELGDISYEELLQKLKKTCAGSGSEEATRDLVDIVKEQTELKGYIISIRNQLNTHRAKVEELTSKYESKEKLLIELGVVSNFKAKLEKEIKELCPLPEGMEDNETFILQYESVEKELKAYHDKKYKLLQERLDIKEEAPEESAEELEKRQKEAEVDFQIVFRKAEAVARIRDLTRNVLAEIDSGTYEGLKKDLERYISFMTDGRHKYVEMETGKGLPCGFVRNDGVVLDYKLLSAGTKDIFSLALRISMAKYFLKEANGFLIMDDPLVDMDPDRQKRAGEIIQKFAEDKQVIIFTCHPTHAEILGGNQIYL